MAAPHPRILCVDDEPAVLEGLSRNLRKGFDVTTASSGADALVKMAASATPFEVVTSDFRMPGMNGVELLRNIRAQSPDTVRMLLTGQADMTTALLAVNEGNVFRFLTKPCAPAELEAALRAGVDQHRLLSAERVLLEQTLHGSIQTLVRVLGLASPQAFGRASRLKVLVTDIAEKLGIAQKWPIEVAAMLSQLGSIVLPPDTLEKVYRGEVLSEEETKMVDRLPGVVEGLLEGIPRLEAVREILRFQTKHFDGAGIPMDRVKGEGIPVGARILKAALDYDAIESRGKTVHDAVSSLEATRGVYDPAVLSALAQLRTSLGKSSPLHELTLVNVKAGMLLASDVKSRSGLLLVARGQVVTTEMLERLRNVAARMGVVEPLTCQIQVGAS
ncbi:MAG TPA: HD domain-containing phosphohydrolase [Polyangiaceae bacterium]